MNGFAFLDINASQIPGSGQCGPAAVREIRAGPRPPGSGTAARTATTTRCKPPSTGASPAACSLRALTPTPMPSTWPTMATGRHSAGMRRACSIEIAPRRRTTSRTRSSLGTCMNFHSATARSGPPAAWLRRCSGDWQFNGVFSAYQGRQYTLSASGAALNMPGNAQTPDQVNPTVDKLGKVGDDGTWFDTTRVCAAHRGPVRHRRPEHHARTRRGEYGLEPVPHVQGDGEGQSAIPRRVVQLEQHAALREPERQCEQLDLREDYSPRSPPRMRSADPGRCGSACVWDSDRAGFGSN